MPKTETVKLNKHELTLNVMAGIITAVEFGYQAHEQGRELKSAILEVIEMFGKAESQVQ